MGVIVVVCATFGLTVSEAKTEISRVYARRGCRSPPPYSSSQRSSICRRPDSHTCFFLFSFCLFGDVAFPEYALYHLLPFSLCMESTSYVFSFRMVFFYLVV